MQSIGKWIFLAAAVAVVVIAGVFYMQGLAERELNPPATTSISATPEPPSAAGRPQTSAPATRLDDTPTSPATSPADAESSPRLTNESSASAGHAPTAHVSGVVVNEEDKPIAGAVVGAVTKLEEFQTESIGDVARTGADGTFRIDALPPDIEVLIAARADGYQYAKTVAVTPADNIKLLLKRGGASISGTVFRHPEGTPLEGVTVTIKPNPSSKAAVQGVTIQESASGALGEFAFGNLAPGSYLLNAEMTGDSRLGMFPSRDLTRLGIAVTENENKPGVDIVMYEGHTIRGKVTDQQSGDPISGARVSTSKDRENFTESGADGNYTLVGVRQESVEMIAEKPGNMIPAPSLTQFSYIQPAPLSLERLDITQNIELQRSITIDGFVRSHDGEPINDAVVTQIRFGVSVAADDAPPRTDHAGAFSIPVQQYSTHRLQAKAGGRPVGISDLIEVADAPVRDVIIIIPNAATASGVVVNRHDDPIGGASVRASATVVMSGNFMMGVECGSMRTDAEGRFEFGELPPGSITISASKTGYTIANIKVENLKPSEHRESLRLVLQDNHYIAGRIMNEEGEPVVVELIMLKQLNGISTMMRGIVKEDGSYRLNNLSDGPISIELNHYGYANTIADSPTVDRDDFDIIMKPKVETELTGRVVDKATGKPLTEFTVDGGVDYDEARPGYFIKRGLTPGHTNFFNINAPGYARLWASVQLAEGELKKEMTFEMGSESAIAGRVLQTAGGEPAAGINVTLEFDEFITGRPSEQIAQTTTDDDGRFTFEALSLGKYGVNIRPSSPHVPIQRIVDITEFGQRRDLGDIPLWSGGTIRGKFVSAPENTPLTGEEIELTRQVTPRDLLTKRTTTDNAGAFEFTGVPEGRYTVSAVNRSAAVEAKLAIGRAEMVEVLLRTGTANLVVRVTHGAAPANGIIVNLETANGGAGPKSLTNQEGVAEFAELMPGVYNASMHKSIEHITASITFSVELVESETVERAVAFGAGSITGRVLNAAGEGIRDLDIEIVREDPPVDRDYEYSFSGGRSVESWIGGQFYVGALEPGTYTLKTEMDGLTAEVTGVVVPESGPMPEVELRPGGPEPQRQMRVSESQMDSMALEHANH